MNSQWVIDEMTRKLIERWKPFPDFPNYLISNLGRIQNVRGHLINIKTREKDNGYPQIRLYKNGIAYYRDIHPIVLKSFIGPASSEKEECNHKDGNKRNNQAWNLEWATRSQNMQHAVRTGLLVIPRGVENHRYGSKMSQEHIDKMKTIMKGNKNWDHPNCIKTRFEKSKENVICLICHKSLKSITNTHLRQHGILPKEYEAQFK